MDVYGEFFHIVDLLNVSNIRHLLYFAYDWRQDNRISARDFDNKLKSIDWSNILNDRKIVFVAHSMGGLLATYWFHKYYDGHQDTYPFKNIERIIFLGTPHTGSLSALQAIIEGYHTDPDSNWFFRCFENIVFNQLNKAGHTFPSFYQLLPFHDKNLITLETYKHRRSHPRLYEIAVWKKFDWLKRIRSSNNKDSFYRGIEPLLEGGVAFNDELYQMGTIPNAVYFYSNSHKTPTRIIVTEEENRHFKTQFVIEERSGDGKVVRESATNWKRVLNEGATRGLSEQHGELPKDDNFIEFIDLMRDAAIANSGSKIAKVAVKHLELLQTFVQERVCLEVPLRMKIWEPSMVGEIIKANNTIIRNIYDLSDDQKVPEYIYRSALATVNSDVRNKLFALSIAQGASGNIKHYSSAALASTLKEQGKLSTAEAFAEMTFYTPLSGLSEQEMSDAKINAGKNWKDIQEQLMKQRVVDVQKNMQDNKINELRTPESNLRIRDENSTTVPARDTRQMTPSEGSKESIIRQDFQKPGFQ